MGPRLLSTIVNLDCLPLYHKDKFTDTDLPSRHDILYKSYALDSLSWHPFGGGWGCEVSCGGHHRPRGKTTTGSALDGAVFDIAQILAYLVHSMSRSQLYLGFGHLADSLLFSVNNILAGLWLNCISSIEIILFLLADILLQHRALFQC